MYHFFAMLSRMKYINRWGLMRSTRPENLSEHSLETAIISHALATIRNTRLGANVNAERAALLALFHDAPEIITGDLPTPVKYFNSGISDVYKDIEKLAAQSLLDKLPDDLKPTYTPLFFQDEKDMELLKIVKAADKLSALIKCIEENKAGNHEFKKAELATRKMLKKFALPEVNIFMEEFLASYALTLDEQE
jgi:5'-deoxynucleotidase